LVTDALIRDLLGIGRGVSYEPLAGQTYGPHQQVQQICLIRFICCEWISALTIGAGVQLPPQLEWITTAVPCHLLEEVHLLDIGENRGLQFVEIDTTGHSGAIPGDLMLATLLKPVKQCGH